MSNPTSKANPLIQAGLTTQLLQQNVNNLLESLAFSETRLAEANEEIKTLQDEIARLKAPAVKPAAETKARPV